MGIRFEDVLASLPTSEQAAVARQAAQLKAQQALFTDLLEAEEDARETPEFQAKLASLSDEYRSEFLLQSGGDSLKRMRKAVEALGGRLSITAEFPDGSSLAIDYD